MVRNSRELPANVKENGMKLTLRIALVACFTFVWAACAAAATKSFVVMPFQVNGPQGYAYLEKAIPSTLASRLTWQGRVQPVAKSVAKAPASAAEAQKAQTSVGADYGVWGSINVMENEAVLTVHVRDKAGKDWSREVKTPVSGLTAAVQNVAGNINREVFGRPFSDAGSNRGGDKPMVNQMNPDIVVNETGQQQVYLNPQFRYQGAGAEDGSRLRSNTLNYVMVDFAVGDFSGNGRNQVAVLSDHKMYIYEWNGGKMKQLAEHTVSMTNQCFSMRAIDLNRDKAKELVITTFNTEDNRPYSYIYTFQGGKLREYAPRSEYFLNVVNMPPHFMPTLVGQSWDGLKLFRPGVYIMQWNGTKYVPGSKLDLPEGANAFNFTWVPGAEGDKLIMSTAQERLKVFAPKGGQIHQTMERFHGSSVGMDHYKTMDGLGADRRYQLPEKYFAPMRMISVDLERKGEYVLLVNKPISTASQFFDRYRYFPQGEIHALYWDGVGLGLKWKTRRIRGSVVDVDMADINNDGIMELVVGLNTHPGAIGVAQRRSMITAYPLDTSLTNPNTPADMSEFEESGQ